MGRIEIAGSVPLVRAHVCPVTSSDEPFFVTACRYGCGNSDLNLSHIDASRHPFYCCVTLREGGEEGGSMSLLRGSDSGNVDSLHSSAYTRQRPSLPRTSTQSAARPAYR